MATRRLVVEVIGEDRSFKKAVKDTADSTGKLEKKFSNLDSTVGDFNRSMTAAGNVVKLVKFPALIAGAGLAAQAMGAAAAGGVALGSALAPLSGLAVAGAAGYTALGQASGTLKLATKGLSEALGGNKDALKALPPAGKQLVELLKGLKPKLKDLQQTAQAGLLPGLASGVKSALPVFKPLKSIIGGTASVLGDLAAKAGRLVGSKGVLQDLTTIGHTNLGVIRNLGTAALLLVRAFIGVIAEAGPLVTWLSKGAVQLARWVAGQVAAGRESGKFAGFLEQTRTVASTLGHILVNLGAALFNIGKSAAPLGRDLLKQIEQLTEKFRDWTGSVKGRNTLAVYFRNAREPIMQIAGLVGDIGGAFLRLSQGKGATPLLKQLRSLVPVLEGVVSSTTSALGPALISSLGDVARLFGHLAGSSGPLVQLVKLIGLIARGFNALLDSVPGLNSMTVSAIGLYGSVKALAVVFGPVAAGAKALEGALLGQTVAANLATGATIRERVSMLATATAMYISAVATGVMTAATVALDTALTVLTSPITLVIAGLALLAAAVIYAYKHSDTFRGIVDAMWATLKTVAGWLITVGVAAFNAVANAVKTAWGVVKTVTETVWNGLKTFLGGIWGAVKTLVTAYFDGYKSVITGVWGAVQTVTTTVWGAIKTILGGVWDGIHTVAVTVWDSIKGAILSPIRAVRDAFTGKDGLWAKIKDDAEKGWEKIKGGAAAFAGALAGAIEDAFEGAVNKVIDFVNAIIGVINKIPGVPNIKTIGHIGGGGGKSSGGEGGPHGTGHLAKGGMVPGSGYGDKVPLHINGRLSAMVEPGEFVSVANRNATAALMRVNSAVPRFQTGGIFNTQEMADLWRSKGGSASLADTMGVIGLVESGGNPNARNPSGASGLWQILGQLVPGNIFNPGVNALNAIAKYKAQGLHAWDASRSKWEPLLGKAVGLDPLALIGKLPGVGGLPDWLKGTGKYVLEHVGKWIKDNVVKLIPGGGGGPTASGPDGVGTFEGIPMANWVIGALKYGRRHGAFGHPTSGYRPGFDPHTASGTSEHQGTRYPHGAVDFGGYHDIRALLEKTSYVRATAGYKYPLLAPQGFVDDGHASGTGHMRGGVLPFVGKFHQGGVAPAEGYAHVAKGEPIGGPLVNIEHAEFGSTIDVNSFAARVGWRVATA